MSSKIKVTIKRQIDIVHNVAEKEKELDIVDKYKDILYNILFSINDSPESFIHTIVPLVLVSKLSSSISKNGNGRANGNTTQEAIFAYILEKHGFKYKTNKEIPRDDCGYYVYQPNGTQRTPDFTIYVCVSSIIKWSIDIDMKQSNTEKIVLNDGWFNNKTIYILSYKSKKQNCVAIGLGQDIPTVLEREKWEQLLKIKKELNSGEKVIDSLHIYFRFANQYNCSKFTPKVKLNYMKSIEDILKR